jgi:hypothetical protein
MGDGTKRLRKTVVLDEADARALSDVAYRMRLSHSEVVRRLIRAAAANVAKGA